MAQKVYILQKSTNGIYDDGIFHVYGKLKSAVAAARALIYDITDNLDEEDVDYHVIANTITRLESYNQQIIKERGFLICTLSINLGTTREIEFTITEKQVR